ncbi:UDP-glucose/GDP-mannose dehydrogenase family protein [Desulfonatronospira sp.]|uniref:UDP-glucose dehydrogenase family protein n=1 Tax=Desulfonatronospira sp. TaxID=1962951 RepID=UPI0025BE2BF3|nr:UDP-glucose/GDP-mannose dehydrogenase family protein [Desulfonatronospira sp.]
MDICIVGTGYVGLVSAACFAEMGSNVYCVDANPEVVETLNQGRVHIFEPGLEELVRRNRDQGRLHFTTDISEGLDNCLFVFICVGTPPGEDGRADLGFVRQVARDVGRNMQDYKIVVDKSTVPVGTADMVRELIQAELDKRGLELEFDVVSNPEFLKEGDAVSDFMKPDRVIVGTDNIRTAELLKVLYSPFARSRDKMMVMGVRSAEMTKYAANCMLATKISFINEIANICEKVGADISDVRRGIGSDHRIGYHFIYPGVGFGGSCFPKDVSALINTAHEKQYTPGLLQAVEEVNRFQKKVLARKVQDYFSGLGGVEGKTLALWGLAFKANTDDVREAPSLEIIKELTSRGMLIKAYDPQAGKNASRLLQDNSSVKVLEDQYEVLQGAHALAVVTEWNQFRNPDLKRIKARLQLPVIFDGRNLYPPRMLEEMGFSYFCMGRKPVLNGLENGAQERI